MTYYNMAQQKSKIDKQKMQFNKIEIKIEFICRCAKVAFYCFLRGQPNNLTTENNVLCFFIMFVIGFQHEEINLIKEKDVG